jgi:hypothetical protein
MGNAFRAGGKRRLFLDPTKEVGIRDHHHRSIAYYAIIVNAILRFQL